MPLVSDDSLRNGINSTSNPVRRCNGIFVLIGVVITVIFLVVDRVVLRSESDITGALIPVILMIGYILWILYSAHRDKRKARRLESMQLTEVIDEPATSNNVIDRHVTSVDATKTTNPSNPRLERNSHENPTFSDDYHDDLTSSRLPSNDVPQT